MPDAQLKVQAGMWDGNHGRHALLLLEGTAHVDQEPITLLNVVLQRGLQLVSDVEPPERVDPAVGWHVRLGPDGALTVEWPHHNPLLCEVPINLPAGWTAAAEDGDGVLVFVGEELGLEDRGQDLLDRIADAAGRGALAGGVAGWHG